MKNDLNNFKSANFKELLDSSYQFPTSFTFKVIIKESQLEAMAELIQKFTVERRASGKGNYVAFSLTKVVASSDEVIEVYKNLSAIPGAITL